jgi:glucose-6-phosphate dehydrogenase assembly protein OpcA
VIENATIRRIERELGELSETAAGPGEPATLRTRVLTHIAWVPREWEEAARRVLDGLGERHPSRTIMLLPDPGAERDGFDAQVDLRCFAYGGPNRSVCSEVIVLWLRGRTATAPASVVQPLLVSDLPVFLRWRGLLPFGASELEQLVEVVDRLVVNSREWSDPPSAYRRLPGLFDSTIVSDIAWARTLPWRRALATLWPGIARAERLRVRGPQADALLLSHWLESRLSRHLELEADAAESLEFLEIDGRPVVPDWLDDPTPSELLSEQLEIYARDAIYEETVASF